jgi:O-antigen ligase
MVIGLAIFSFQVLSSLMTSYDRNEALHSSFGFLLRGMAPGFIAYRLVLQDQKERFLSNAIILFGLVIGVTAVWEVISGDYFLFERYQPLIEPSEGFATGVLSQPLPFAILLCLILPISLQLAYQEKGLVSILSSVVIMTGIILTYRRSGYLMLLVSVIGTLIFVRHSLKGVLITLSLVTFCVVLVWSIKPINQQFTKRFRYADVQNRMELTSRGHSISFRMAKDHPILGIGTRQYHNAYKNYSTYDFTQDSPDSQYLRFLSENGYVGLFLFMGFLFFVLQRSFIGRGEPFGVGIFLSILNLTVAQIINDSLYWPTLQFLAWIIMGMGVALADRNRAGV